MALGEDFLEQGGLTRLPWTREHQSRKGGDGLPKGALKASCDVGGCHTYNYAFQMHNCKFFCMPLIWMSYLWKNYARITVALYGV